MRNILYKNTILLLTLFVSSSLFSQKKFDLQVSESQFELESKNLVGYQTAFDFSREEVRKGWWKYSRKFGNPLDMRTYYVVKIPSDATDGNVELTVYGQSVETDSGAKFSIGIDEKKYKVQVEELLKEFKKDFYIQYYLSELKLKELEAGGLSDQYARAVESEKEDLLNSLNSKRREMDEIKGWIKEVEEQ